jgi:hypothetical protein
MDSNYCCDASLECHMHCTCILPSSEIERTSVIQSHWSPVRIELTSYISRQYGTIHIYIYEAVDSLGGMKRAQPNYSYKAK